jgi:prepilin-type N-terminal cleavage/methylation domain-containing protein
LAFRARARARWRRAGERGFTLVEVMVSATILLLAIGVLGPMLTSMVRNTNRVSNEADALDAARLALRQLGNDVAGAGCVAAPATGATAAQLVLVGRDSAGAPVPITWSVASGVLTRTVTTAGTTVTADQVSDLVGAPSFTRLADGRVDIRFSVLVDQGRATRPLGAIVGAHSPEAACPG